MSTPSEVQLRIDAITAPPSPASTTTAPDAEQQSSSTPVAEVDNAIVTGTKNFIQDLSPLADRLRPYADVFLPFIELMDDSVVQDLRDVVRAPLMRAREATARLDLGRVTGAARMANTGARRLANVREKLPARSASLAGTSLQRTRAARLAPVTLPSVNLAIGSALRSLARRLRPGRWAFRTVAVVFVALVATTPTLQQAMLEEIKWTRAALESIKIPPLQIEIPAFQLSGQDATIPSKLAPAQFDLPPLDAYSASFETQAAYPTVAANKTVEWVVALRNSGSVGWYRGISGAQAALALADGTEVAVQTTGYVAPGEIGWFIAKFRAPAVSGTHTVALFPRIDGRGNMPDLGIFALVTVR